MLLPSLVTRRVSIRPCIYTIIFPRHYSYRSQGHPSHLISSGVTTAPKEEVSSNPGPQSSKAPYYFETGYAIYAKRASRPFPPPFLSKPSGSYSEPLTTHGHARYRQQPSVNGQQIRGQTNGDDAIIIGDHNFLGVNDGVGAWAQKEKGHAALWSRLIAHFWALEVEKAMSAEQKPDAKTLDPVGYLQTAFEQTQTATASPNNIEGTTTACSALLYHRTETQPIIYATSLGDCAVMVVRPRDREIIYKSEEQWHWFDCPRQLGTNSPDTPRDNATMDVIDIEEGDVVAALSDGVTDNLWDHEICTKIVEALEKWKSGAEGTDDGMEYVARELMEAARTVAVDMSAESPFMERSIDEGIPTEGGKNDDISVVLGLCKKSKG